jgi:hypothetical protein
MNIHLVRTGGFGGMRREARVGTESLPSAEREPLERLVGEAGFFALPEKFPKPKRGADYFTYTVTVEDGGRRHTVEVAQPQVPENLRPLIRELSKRL